MNLVLFILTFLLQSGLVISQSIPQNHYSYQSRKLLYDAGDDWNTLTNFGPIRFKSEKMNLSSFSDWRIGFSFGNQSYSINGYGLFRYNNHYYGYYYPSFLGKTESSKNEKSVLVNQDSKSGIGLENQWIMLQFGRGNENWGSGNDIQLALSENSGNYDYLILASDYGKVRVKYIYGFLENVQPNINRYITARGLEWTNRKSLIIGLSETVIYSGENRSMDIGYLNPISSHLEIELNNRLNTLGDGNSNAVWQLHLDYLLFKNFRVSLNYLYDEFVLDPDIQIGKEHGKAYSIRLAYTPIFSNNHLFTLYSNFIYVGSPTFRHGMGTNNFVQNGRPLGWYMGSDGQEFCIGFNYFNNDNLILNFSNGFLQIGEETITNRIFEPYADYQKGKFPSGKVISGFNYKAKIIYFLSKNHSVSAQLEKSPIADEIYLKVNVPFSSSMK